LAKQLYILNGGLDTDDLLLRVPGMSVELIARFFKSASKFYHAGNSLIYPAVLRRAVP
jgi:hypothetical protein